MLYDQLEIRSDHMISKYKLLVSSFFFEKVLIACITKGCGIFHSNLDELEQIRS